MVSPELKLLTMACPPQGSMPQATVAQVRQLMPGDTRHNIAVFAETEGIHDVVSAGRTIPFFGMLIGLAYVGHAVWVFPGPESAVPAACRGADLLLVDSVMSNRVTAQTLNHAAELMRSPNILVHDRANYKLRVFRQAGAPAENMQPC